MSQFWKFGSAAAALAMLAGAEAATPAASVLQEKPNPPAPSVAGNVASGKKLYYDNGCYGCHGYTGESRIPLVGSKNPALVNEQNFRSYLRLRGDRISPAPSTSMPHYPERALSDAKVRDIYAFIRSLRSNTPAAATVSTADAILKAAAKPQKQ